MRLTILPLSKENFFLPPQLLFCTRIWVLYLDTVHSLPLAILVMVMDFSGAERDVSRMVRGQLLEVTWSGFEMGWAKWSLRSHLTLKFYDFFFCLTCPSEKGWQEMENRNNHLNFLLSLVHYSCIPCTHSFIHLFYIFCPWKKAVWALQG